MDSDQLKMGMQVRTTREFSGVPSGTIGRVVEASDSWPETDSVAIQWSRFENDTLTDWFSFDDLKYLVLV